MSIQASPQNSPREGDPVLAVSNGRNQFRFLVTLLSIILLVLAANVWLTTILLKQRAQESREHFFWLLSHPGYSPAERTVAFRRLLAEGNREWRGAQLADLDLNRLSMPG